MAGLTPRHVIRPLDWLVIGTVLAASLAGLWFSWHGVAGATLFIEQDGMLLYSAPLEREARVTADGPLGPTVIEVSEGGARVVSATCPHRVCMAMGTIDRQGEVVACVPNKVLLRISGNREDQGYDLLSR